MVKKIKLGSKVRCKLSGLEGIAVHRTEFINGCVQYGVLPKATDNKPIDDVGVDEQSLEVIKKVRKKPEKARGGANTHSTGMRGF